MAEKSNAELLRILTAKFRKAEEGGALSNQKVAYAKWLKDNTGVKLLKDGTRETVWKSGANKGQKFNPKEGSKLFNKEYWGTETPKKDLKYLQESERSRLRIKTQRGDSLRTRWSKDDFEGKNIYQQEVTARETKDKARLAKLRVGTSFADSELQSQKAKLKKNVSNVEIATINDKLAKQRFNRNLLSDSDAQFMSEAFNTMQSVTGGDRLEGIGYAKGNWPGEAKPGDTDFKVDGESLIDAKITEKDGVATVEVPKKSWSDIKGMKRGRERDKLALEYYKDRGIDFDAKTRGRQRDIASELYIDNRVYVKDKGWTSIEDVEKGQELFHHNREGFHKVTSGKYE
jgi:hypothetical protein